MMRVDRIIMLRLEMMTIQYEIEETRNPHSIKMLYSLLEQVKRKIRDLEDEGINKEGF